MRRGVTLAELLIAMAVGLMLAGVCQDLFRRANRLFEGTRRQVESTTDLRALVETLARDVAAAQHVLATSATELEVFRAADAAPHARLAKNAGWAFPFTAGATTTQRAPGLRVRYAWSAVTRKVTRTEEPGDLVARTTTRVATLDRFAFEAAGPATAHAIAREVHACAFHALTPACVAVEARTPTLHLMVPLWSAKHRSDAVYPESFSSTDDDLSW